MGFDVTRHEKLTDEQLEEIRLYFRKVGGLEIWLVYLYLH